MASAHRPGPLAWGSPVRARRAGEAAPWTPVLGNGERTPPPQAGLQAQPPAPAQPWPARASRDVVPVGSGRGGNVWRVEHVHVVQGRVRGRGRRRVQDLRRAKQGSQRPDTCSPVVLPPTCPGFLPEQGVWAPLGPTRLSGPTPPRPPCLVRDFSCLVVSFLCLKAVPTLGESPTRSGQALPLTFRKRQGPLVLILGRVLLSP